MRWPTGERLCYGGDYNPEQWLEEVWARDVELMRRAGVNLVSVGVFAWSSLEPVAGRYTFGWLDRVLDLLHAGGVRVALATPTASPPPWFSVAYPDALPMTRDGVRLVHGSRDTYCVASPEYRDAATRIARELASRYAKHPALALWHVHNEYGTRCFCDRIAAAFRSWLRARYGELDRLNEAWTTAFWSQRYSDWAQVLPPRATQYLPNPTHELDFRRFLSDELLAAFREQRAVLRELTPHVPVTTNFAFAGWVPVDHRRWATEVDVVAIDDYPTVDRGAEEQTAFAADLARGWAGGASWLLMEQAPSTLNVGSARVVKAPGRMARLSLCHVARGSRGAMFFQWRASRGGAELHHAAMVPHAGPDSRVFREVVELGGILQRIAGIEGAVEADAAILWDAESWWAAAVTELPSSDVDPLAAVRQARRALWRAGICADVVHPSDDLSRYRLVVVPGLYLVSDEAATAIAATVAAGGHAVVSYLSGIVDSDAQVRLGGHPGAFRDLLGIRVEEFLPLSPGGRAPLSTGDGGRLWSESVRLAGAETVVAYADGGPAVTRHAYGAGVAWYLSTGLDDEPYQRLIATIAAQAGVVPVVPGVPAGVEAVRRRGARQSWLFLINHGTDPADVPAAGLDLLTGRRVDGVARLPAGGYAVIREDGGHGRPDRV